MTNKDKYTQFCAERQDIPIFSQPYWLDAVCPDQWDVILIERNDKVIASFPYCKTKLRKVFTHIGMPPLTQKLGPYIVYESDKLSENKRISFEHKIYNEIIDKLPKSDNLLIHFDWKYKNWLPFYWKGFKQTTRYTYILDGIKDHERLIANYDSHKREKIKKAEKESLEIKFDFPADEFYSYFTHVIHERSDSVSFSKELFIRLYNAMYQYNYGRTFYCVDNEKNIHAIHMVVWDNECAYSLISMRDKKYNTSGGREFLVDAIIKYVSQFVNRFDFEGSMIQGVEESYRRHGTHQTEYYAISKCINPVLRIIRAIRGT